MDLHVPGLPAGVTGWRQLASWPNLLSALRLPLGGAFLLAGERNDLEMLILLLAGATDIADGQVARRLGQVSRLGGVVDPVCDKLFLLCCVVALVWQGRLDMQALLLLMTRELLLLPQVVGLLFLSRAARARLSLKATLLGKAATVTQFTALLVAMFYPVWLAELCQLAGLLGILGALGYLLRGLQEVRRPLSNPASSVAVANVANVAGEAP